MPIKKQTLFDHLAIIEDPRIERTKQHLLIDILVDRCVRCDVRG